MKISCVVLSTTSFLHKVRPGGGHGRVGSPMRAVASVAALGAVLALTGCGASTLFPDVETTGAGGVAANAGVTKGQNWGGHAPLVGAHVFVLEGYTSASGYGQKAKSLLTTSSPNASYPTALEPAGSAMSGNYYVKTDQYGYFYLSGDYTCDPGYPVYLYAAGGNAQAPTTGGSVATVASATISGTGPYTVKVTVATANQPSLLYQGESITFTGSGSTFATYLNGSTQGVLADTNLTTSTFAFTTPSLTNNGVTVSTGAQTVGTLTYKQATAPNNPAVVNLAMMGLCPTTGTANFSYLTGVFMNEVSTAAMAYAMGGFFPAPGSSGLAVAGAVAGNLSIPASNSVALLGLQNAALTAGQLYDIQGSLSGCAGGIACDGESHIARPTTPGLPITGTTTAGSPTVTALPTTAGLAVGMTITGSTLPAGATIAAVGTNTLTLSTGTGVSAGTGTALFAGAGGGTVPQALLNTVGNILANCVDSANTSSAASTQCSLLFGYTPSAGTSGTLPVDTASAAIDIAHNPWANVASLYNLPTGNVPFQPTLTGTPNDLTAGIVYRPTNVSQPEGIAIDRYGQIWYPNAASSYLTALNPFGGIRFNTLLAGSPHYLTIDANGSQKVYVASSSAGTDYVQQVSATTGALLATTPSYSVTGGNYGIAADGLNDTGYIYVGGGTGGVYQYNGNLAQVGTLSGATSGACSGISQSSHMSVDNAANGYNVWLTQESGDICSINSTSGAVVASVASSLNPEVPAIDASGNAWIPRQLGNAMLKVTQTGATTVPAGGTLSNPFGAAVDGVGNVFVTNRVGNSVTEYLGSTGNAVSSVNLEGTTSAGGTIMNDPLNLLVDQSGYLWITNFYGSRIVQLLGVAAPTLQPLSEAANQNKLGSRP